MVYYLLPVKLPETNAREASLISPETIMQNISVRGFGEVPKGKKRTSATGVWKLVT